VFFKKFEVQMSADLDIELFGARDLPKANPRIRQRPYGILKIDGLEDDYETPPGASATDPEWNHIFHFEGLELPTGNIALTITIMHKTQFIGSLNLNFQIDAPESQDGLDQWLQLKSQDNVKPTGEVHLGIRVLRWVPLAPAEEEDSSSFSSRSPTKTVDVLPLTSPSPRSKQARLRNKIEHDQADPDAIQNAAEPVARQKYFAYLKTRTPLLRQNAKLVKKYREEIQKND
jgi:hypothetical protein